MGPKPLKSFEEIRLHGGFARAQHLGDLASRESFRVAKPERFRVVSGQLGEESLDPLLQLDVDHAGQVPGLRAVQPRVTGERGALASATERTDGVEALIPRELV